MKHGEKLLICLMAVGALCARANAITANASSSPYQEIVERNVFGLRPPPPPPDPEASKPPPPQVKITLTGITTILGNKRALMKTPAAPPKPGEQPKGEQSFILSEGQRDGDIEVIQIDEKAGSVKVNNAGNIVTLTFDKDGVKLANTPLPATPTPGLPVPSPTGVIPPPPVPGANPYTPPGTTPSFNMPTRNLRLPSAGIPNSGNATMASYTPSPGGTYGTPGAFTPAGTVPVGGNPAPAGVPIGSLTASPTGMPKQQNWPPERHDMSLEEQQLLNAVQNEVHKNNPNWIPIPGAPGSTVNNPNPTTGTQNSPGNPWPPRAPSLPPLLPQ